MKRGQQASTNKEEEMAGYKKEKCMLTISRVTPQQDLVTLAGDSHSTTDPITGMLQRQDLEYKTQYHFANVDTQGILQLNPVGPYPLPQPIMSNSEISKPAAKSVEVYVCNKGISNVTTEPFTHQGSI